MGHSRKVALGLTAIAMLWGASAAYAAGSTFEASLNGANEVSSTGQKGVGDPDGTGEAFISISSNAKELCFGLEWDDIASPTAAHIHRGSPDEAGPVVVTLFGGSDVPPSSANGAKDCLAGVDRSVAKAIRKDPGAYYVNVHNADYPGGAIRGQLESA